MDSQTQTQNPVPASPPPEPKPKKPFAEIRVSIDDPAFFAVVRHYAGWHLKYGDAERAQEMLERIGPLEETHAAWLKGGAEEEVPVNTESPTQQ